MMKKTKKNQTQFNNSHEELISLLKSSYSSVSPSPSFKNTLAQQLHRRAKEISQKETLLETVIKTIKRIFSPARFSFAALTIFLVSIMSYYFNTLPQATLANFGKLPPVNIRGKKVAFPSQATSSLATTAFQEKKILVFKTKTSPLTENTMNNLASFLKFSPEDQISSKYHSWQNNQAELIIDQNKIRYAYQKEHEIALEKLSLFQIYLENFYTQSPEEKENFEKDFEEKAENFLVKSDLFTAKKTASGQFKTLPSNIAPSLINNLPSHHMVVYFHPYLENHPLMYNFYPHPQQSHIEIRISLEGNIIFFNYENYQTKPNFNNKSYYPVIPKSQALKALSKGEALIQYLQLSSPPYTNYYNPGENLILSNIKINSLTLKYYQNTGSHESYLIPLYTIKGKATATNASLTEAPVTFEAILPQTISGDWLKIPLDQKNSPLTLTTNSFFLSGNKNIEIKAEIKDPTLALNEKKVKFIWSTDEKTFSQEVTIKNNQATLVLSPSQIPPSQNLQIKAQLSEKLPESNYLEIINTKTEIQNNNKTIEKLEITKIISPQIFRAQIGGKDYLINISNLDLCQWAKNESPCSPQVLQEGFQIELLGIAEKDTILAEQIIILDPAAPLIPPSPTPEDISIILRGNTLSKRDNNPLAFVQINLSKNSQAPSLTSFSSDENGFFDTQIKLSPGSYLFTLTKEGFQTKRQKVEVSKNQKTFSLNISLEPKTINFIGKILAVKFDAAPLELVFQGEESELIIPISPTTQILFEDNPIEYYYLQKGQTVKFQGKIGDNNHIKLGTPPIIKILAGLERKTPTTPPTQKPNAPVPQKTSPSSTPFSPSPPNTLIPSKTNTPLPIETQSPILVPSSSPSEQKTVIKNTPTDIPTKKPTPPLPPA